MNGENLNTGTSTNFNSGEMGILPPARAQEIGQKTHEVARYVSFRDDMINKLSQTLSEHKDPVNVFREIDRPDQTYQKGFPGSSRLEALGSVAYSLIKDEEAGDILRRVSEAIADKNVIVHSYENQLLDIYSKYPTVLDFDDGVAEKLVSDKEFSEDAMRKFEEGAYGERQVECLEILHSFKGNNHEVAEEEKLFDSVSAFMLSKDQVANIEPARGSQDTAYAENGLFAVFDGVGGSEDGQGASQLCARNIENIVGQVDFMSDYGKKFVIGALNYTLKEAGTRGSTTSVITKLVQGDDGKRTLHYVSVGDSRLYVVRKDGTAEQVTHDDAMTDDQIMTVLNSRSGNKKLSDMAMRYARAGSEEAKQALLAGSPMRKDLVEDMARLARQCMDHGISKSLHGGSDIEISEGNMGSIELNKGDQLVLCSDGITGDVAADRMSNEDLARAVHGFSSDEAVANLMQRAKKIDDRTAIVVNI